MADNFKLKTAVSDPLTFASDESAEGVHAPLIRSTQLQDILEVTLSLDTSAYADGDVLAATQEIASALRENGATGTITSLVVCDKDDQGVALDVVFLQTNVAIGTENAAVSATDAAADEVLGIVEVAAGDYVDLVNAQVAPKHGLNIPVKAASDSTSLFVAAISRGTGTYTASGITLKVGITRN